MYAGPIQQLLYIRGSASFDPVAIKHDDLIGAVGNLAMALHVLFDVGTGQQRTAFLLGSVWTLFGLID